MCEGQLLVFTCLTVAVAFSGYTSARLA
ncbi:DUF233 protein, partial [Danaus plexippus plexippus]